MLQTLRPVGNKIYNKPRPFRSEIFSPYFTQYYQSGTAALSAALIVAKKRAPKIEHPRILIPAYTCPDVISAALYANVEPVLIDLEPESPWMSLTNIKNELESDSTIIAVVAINFLGIPERINELSKLTKLKNIVLIEDSAQDFPSEINDFSSESDLIISSFGKGKPIGLLGGGVVLTKNTTFKNLLPTTPNRDALFIERLKYKIKVSLYNIIITPFFYFLLSHFPLIKLGRTIFKPLKELTACPQYILNLIEYNFLVYSRNKTVIMPYKDMLARLNSDKIIDLPTTCNVSMDKSLLRYPILVNDAKTYKELKISLEKAGLGVSIMYKNILPKISGITDSMYKKNASELKNANHFAAQLITLPTHQAVSNKTLKKITDIFNSVI